MRVRTAKWSSGRKSAAVGRFLDRPAFDSGAEDSAREILAEIRQRGTEAVLECARRFDGVELAATGLRVPDADLQAAAGAVDAGFRKAAREACRRITAFAKAGMKKDWKMSTPHGGTLGEMFTPYERVGVYIPGGKAPLASTALMTATLAKVAGVKQIVACTPCGSDGQVNPYVLHALKIAGATEVYRVGGIHSIGMMAYGVKGIPKVQKIVGPGGAYVTAAKRQVYGDVALDLVAGPSEIAVLADDTADAACVAMDLLSQAEHGTGGEKALLVTPSQQLVDAVKLKLDDFSAELSRRAAIEAVANNGGIMLVTVDTLDDAVELCNRFAPEHLELMVKSPRRLLKKIRCAGAVFVGKWTPESAGDFVAGPSHVLPTGGAAAMFAGLTVDDFMRRSSVIEFSRDDLKATLSVIEAFGRVEGLDAHARSAAIRFER